MPPLEKLTPPRLLQIKQCSDKEQLLRWREYLMKNVQRLIIENILEWSLWEEMICRIDNKVDGTPIVDYRFSRDTSVKKD